MDEGWRAVVGVNRVGDLPYVFLGRGSPSWVGGGVCPMYFATSALGVRPTRQTKMRPTVKKTSGVGPLSEITATNKRDRGTGKPGIETQENDKGKTPGP